jgi:phospholipid-binding lipoprotein MlaA
MKTVSPIASLFVALLVAALLAGCATARAPGDASSPADGVEGANDPFESFNRAMYGFNDTLDRYVLKPVAKGYRAALPGPVRKGVSNFFSNLREPIVFVNNALQGKLKNAASDLGRFLTNSTIGVFGLFDVATEFGLERHNEDLGQTLGVWGVKEGPYLVLPFFGPSTIRDGVSLYGDYQLYPPRYVEDDEAMWALYITEVIDTRARLLDAGDILDQAAGDDPYLFVREAYRQRRRSLIGDGAAPAPSPLDPSIFDDDRPAPKKSDDSTPPTPQPPSS